MSTFNPPADIAQITLAKSSDVNAVKSATAIAFGLLPSETKLQRGTVNFAVDTGTANTYVVALDASITAYTDGLQVVFRPLNDNTGSATINLNSLGAKSIRLTDSEAIQAGDISAGAVIDVRYSTSTGFFHLTPNSAIYAHDAGVSATAAAASAVASAGSASDALSYRNSAEGYKNTAVSSAAAAGSSAVASAGSASDSLSYRNTAEGYKNTAVSSAAAASSSAAASAGSASDALSYRNTAEGYKNTAGDSAVAAGSSATSAAAAYDSFDDRYLGAKASNPTLDNDGNALLTGALYWNTTSSEMRVYSGSAWVTAYLPASGYLALSGGTMTGDIVFSNAQNIDATTLKSATTTINVASATAPTAGQILKATDSTHAIWGDLPPSGGSITAVASGTLPNGAVIVLNSDGTVSDVSANIAAVGSQTILISGMSGSLYRGCLDTVNNKIFVCFQYSSQFYAIVGTITGTSISFGSPYNTGLGYIYDYDCVYDPYRQRIVVAYVSSSSGYLVAFQISGTTLTMGSPLYHSGGGTLSCCFTYNSDLNYPVLVFTIAPYGYWKIIGGSGLTFSNTGSYFDTTAYAPYSTTIAYNKQSASCFLLYISSDTGNYRLYYSIGIDSGLSITWSPKVMVIDTGVATSYPMLSVSIDNTNKVAFCYMDNVLNKAFIQIATLTSTSAAFGGRLAIPNVYGLYYWDIAYDSNNNTILLVGRNQSSPYGSTLHTYSISGDDLSLVSITALTPYNTSDQCIVMNNSDGKAAIFGNNNGSNANGYGFVYKPANITDTSVIGISQNSYTDGQTATIGVVGNKSTNLSGLTTGKKYYVNSITGLLQTTATNVYIGKALSATSLLVKG